MNVQNELKTTVSNIGHKLHSLGFWIIIILMIGFYAGMTYTDKRNSDKVGEAIQLKGMIYEGSIYDIQKRVDQ